MNVYDEALNGLEAIRKELQDRLNFPVNLTPEYRGVKKSLERAKKVEEELEEYKISDKSKEESSIEYYNLYKETKRKLKKVEELLKLYQKFSNILDIDIHERNVYQYTEYFGKENCIISKKEQLILTYEEEIIQIFRQIKALEDELK